MEEENMQSRSFMASTKFGNKMYLFGGSNTKNECTN